MKKNKMIRILSALCLVAMILTGCGGGESKKKVDIGAIYIIKNFQKEKDCQNERKPL